MSAINTDVRVNPNTLEYGKFVELNDTTTFPYISVNRISYDDNLSAVDVYRKYAVLTYDAGTAQPNSSIFGDSAAIDAFGKLRVSNPTSQFDSKFIYGKMPWVWDEIVLSGSSNFIQGDSMIVMTTSAIDAYAIRQTYCRWNYNPGKSTSGIFSGVLAPEVNIIKRVGLFQGLTAHPHTPTDGIYLESKQSGVSFNLIKTIGTQRTTVVPQSAWNIDKMDGTGITGIALDFTKGQIFTFDYEWLGIGRVRLGFVVNGKIIYAHYESHANELTAPYIASPNQPVRYEMRQIGPGNGSLKQICSSVISEGGLDIIGTSISAQLSGAISNVDTVYRPILAVRVDPASHDMVAIIQEIELFNTGNQNIQYQLLLDPIISGGAFQWQRAGTSGYSPIQQAEGSISLTVSNGFIIHSGFVGNSTGNTGAVSSGQLLGNVGRLGYFINGTPTTIVVAARALSTTTNIWCAINLLMKS